jgi:hypothetical protein
MIKFPRTFELAIKRCPSVCSKCGKKINWCLSETLYVSEDGGIANFDCGKGVFSIRDKYISHMFKDNEQHSFDFDSNFFCCLSKECVW